MARSDFNELTGRHSGEHMVAYQEHLLHPQVIEPFLAMQKKAKQEAGCQLELVSSFRSYQRQLCIWNEKACGVRKVYNSNGDVLDLKVMQPQDQIQAICRYSAIAGASRHHWGTDLDVYDAKVKSKDQVQLSEQECREDFSLLHAWLDENLAQFEFFRPYDKDTGGIAPEKWHLSFAPISNAYTEDYSLEVFEKNIQDSDLELKNHILQQLEYYFDTFVLIS